MNKVAAKLITSVCLMLAVGNPSQAKEWCGIKPLRSTREDVVRLLGPSPDANDLRSNYRTDTEDVYIVFAGKGFCDANPEKLPPGTVLLVQVEPKTEMRLADLQVDEKKFRRFDPSTPPDTGYEGYLNEEDGIVVRTFQGRVDQIAYMAAAKDKHLCPEYYESPEMFLRVVVTPP